METTTGTLHIEGWAGRLDIPVEVIGETPKKLRVRLLQGVMLQGKRRGQANEIVLVPKSAVTRDTKTTNKEGNK